MSNIANQLKILQQRIDQAAHSAAREKEDILLLCVSKTKPIEQILEAYSCGYRHFGESYINEAVAKITSLKEQGYQDIVWHFIGPIQKNKTKAIAQNFDVVESVDREIIATRLNEQRPTHLKPLEILIEVNISSESQKSGCRPEDLPALIEHIKQHCPALKLRGLMGIAQQSEDPTVIAANFAELEKLFLDYKTQLSDFDLLSMGMSEDLEIAIAHGSNEVRIGTAIFGARSYPAKEMSVTIGFIGGGNMASCIFESLKKNQPQAKIFVSGPHLGKLQHFAQKGATITTDNLEVVKNCEQIFLCVKPQHLTAVLNQIKGSQLLLEDKLFISLAAGFKITSISKILGSTRLIRIMPNTPARLGLGVTALTCASGTKSSDKEQIKRIVQGLGLCLECDEKQLNVIGAIAGCGPAFVFSFMQGLVTKAIQEGLEPQAARAMVEKTLIGAATLSEHKASLSLDQLIAEVASKGGTTEAGLLQLQEHNFSQILAATVQAALDKTTQLENNF